MAIILQYVGALSMMLPAASIVYFQLNRKRKKHEYSYWLFVLYFSVAFFFQTTISALSLAGTTNVNIVRVYVVVEMLLLGGFLLILLQGNKALTLTKIFALITVPILIDILFGEINNPPYEMIVINCLAFSLLGFKTVAKVNILVSERKYSWYYYIILGILIYSLNNVVVFGFASVTLFFAYNLHAILVVTQNILFTKGVICYHRQQ
jgi:hypothetical protein